MVRLLLHNQTKYLLITLLSLPLVAGNNAITVEHKGTSSVINVKQVGYTNNATVYCGLSAGIYSTHTCTRATINLNTKGS